MITEQAPGIYSVEHETAEGKNAVIIGAAGALAVDTGKYPHEGQMMADFILSQHYQPDRLVLTHGHDDHVLGGRVFEGSIVFAHMLAPTVMHRQISILVARTGDPYEHFQQQAIWPTVTFEGRLRIDLGDKRVLLFPTPGHSQDGISIYVEEDRVLVAGDSVVTGIVPALWDGDSRVLEATLRGLIELDMAVLIPGHGPVLHGAARIRDWLGWLAAYLAGVRTFVHEALAQNPSVDLDALAASADYDRFIGSRLPAEKHNMPDRHRTTVRHIAEEALAAPGNPPGQE